MPKDDQKPSPDSDNQSQMWRDLGLFGVIIGEVVGLTLAGLGLGYGLSRWIGLSSLSMPICGVAGLTLAMFRISKMRKK